MNLDWLARKHGTDKSLSSHGYTVIYEQVLGAHRDKIHSLLELGISDGASLRMWKDWLPNATIYGVDISDSSLDAPFVTYKIEQTDEQKLKDTFHDKYLQVIIDDCSHDPEKTLRSLEILFPLLENEGWYVIEDMDPSNFPAIMATWMAQHREIKSVQFFMDRGGGSWIIFIRK